MATKDKNQDELHVRNSNSEVAARQVDEEGEELLDVNPTQKTCPYCKAEVITYVEHETSPAFYAFLLISMFAFGWMFLILVPFAYIMLKNAVHRCSRCLNEIGVKQMFYSAGENEVFILHLGKASIVISKKIGIAIFTVLSVIFLYFAWFYDWGVKQERSITESINISSTWEEYVKDCGSTVVIANNFKANEIFKRKYKNNIVNWSGYYIEKKKVEGFSLIENSHSLNILVKMEPTETEFEPDIVLSFTGSVHLLHKSTIDSLNNGDQINFSAKFISIGDEFSVNHLHAITIEKTGQNKSLPEIQVNDRKLPQGLKDQN